MENSKIARAAHPEPKRPVQQLRPRVRAGRLVRDLMTEKVFTVTPADDLATLYDLMDSRRVRHVPVVEGMHLVGIITEADFVSDFLKREGKS